MKKHTRTRENRGERSAKVQRPEWSYGDYISSLVSASVCSPDPSDSIQLNPTQSTIPALYMTCNEGAYTDARESWGTFREERRKAERCSDRSEAMEITSHPWLPIMAHVGHKLIFRSPGTVGLISNHEWRPSGVEHIGSSFTKLNLSRSETPFLYCLSLKNSNFNGIL